MSLRTITKQQFSDGTTIDGNRIEQALQERFGTQYRVRLFVSDSLTDATNARDAAMQSSTESAKWAFAEQCVNNSTHPSAPRGGLIESISPASPIYPQALRAALRTTPMGSCSPVLSTEAGYVAVFVESQTPPRTIPDDDSNQIQQQLVLGLQRQAMQELAQEILESQDVIVMDKSLNWSWTNAP